MINSYFVVLLAISVASCSSNTAQNQVETANAKTNLIVPGDSGNRLEILRQENASIIINSKDNNAEKFDIEVFRISTVEKLVNGILTVNGKTLGNTFENDDLKIMPGTYPGFLRYISQNGHVQGQDGYLGETGDFLLEIGNVTWSNGQKRNSLLFHGGNKPAQSQGCIMLGPVSRDGEGNRVLGNDHPLRKLRFEFYGTNDPISSPNKTIKITIK